MSLTPENFGPTDSLQASASCDWNCWTSDMSIGNNSTGGPEPDTLELTSLWPTEPTFTSNQVNTPIGDTTPEDRPAPEARRTDRSTPTPPVDLGKDRAPFRDSADRAPEAKIDAAELFKGKLEKLAGELAGRDGKFMTDEEFNKLYSGKIKQEDIFMHRLRKSLKDAAGTTGDIKPAVEMINKKLAELKSPYRLSAEATDLGDETMWKLNLTNKDNPEKSDKILVMTQSEKQLKAAEEKQQKHDDQVITDFANQFGSGKFMTPEEVDAATSGEKSIRDTTMGKLMEKVWTAVEKGEDPIKMLEKINQKMEASKSPYKLELEPDGIKDGVRIRIKDAKSGKESDKMFVPYKRI